MSKENKVKSTEYKWPNINKNLEQISMKSIKNEKKSKQSIAKCL